MHTQDQTAGSLPGSNGSKHLRVQQAALTVGCRFSTRIRNEKTAHRTAPQKTTTGAGTTLSRRSHAWDRHGQGEGQDGAGGVQDSHVSKWLATAELLTRIDDKIQEMEHFLGRPAILWHPPLDPDKLDLQEPKEGRRGKQA